MMSAVLYRSAMVAGFFVLLHGQLFAQFSPGELTTAHAALEGINNCTSCHELGKKIDGNKCLECHMLIRTRQSSQKGYHGSSQVRSKECVSCHLDHKGRGFDMIKWEGGKAAFPHDLTGFKLDGRHKTDRCEACHKPDFIKDRAVQSRASEGLSLKKTYLGLSANCQSCHFDEHRGQFEKSCTQCHDTEDWKKSAELKFDHNQARFKLTGKHAEAQCVLCHKPVSDSRVMPDGKTDADYLKFRELKFDRCTACHVDPHGGRFGTNCEKCHKPGGWQNVTISGFDHTRTGYPLIGKHQLVDCEKCHKPDPKKKSIYKGLPHDACTVCHTDAHAGQFSKRADAGRCESCHTPNGFVPSLFTPDYHNAQSRFQLAGAHMAVACNQCHVRVDGPTFLRRTGIRSDSLETIFHFPSMRCADCHTDVHRGQFDERVKSGGCESCHVGTDDWKQLAFDHNTDSRFPLKGKHAAVACDQCHKVTSDGNETFVSFKPTDMRCQTCHLDIHYGQFSDPITHLVLCDACHNEDGFKKITFDHNRQSRFSLTGSHEKVPCEKCHQAVTLANGVLVNVFKPVDVRCSSCHATMR